MRQYKSVPIRSSDCIAIGKTWTESTDVTYSPLEQETKDYFERLEKLGRVGLEIYDLNNFSVKIKGIFKGIWGSGVAVYQDGKFVKTVSLRDAKLGYLFDI